MIGHRSERFCVFLPIFAGRDGEGNEQKLGEEWGQAKQWKFVLKNPSVNGRSHLSTTPPHCHTPTLPKILKTLRVGSQNSVRILLRGLVWPEIEVKVFVWIVRKLIERSCEKNVRGKFRED